MPFYPSLIYNDRVFDNDIAKATCVCMAFNDIVVNIKQIHLNGGGKVSGYKCDTYRQQELSPILNGYRLYRFHGAQTDVGNREV